MKCANCERLQTELDEKTKQLTIIKKNILEVKSHIFESSSLISAYLQTKNQNENLQKEIELYRKKKEENFDKYQLDILKQKLITKIRQYNELKLAYDQTSSMLELMQKEVKENVNITKENKLKRQISEKDKYINSQNLIIEKLKDENQKIKSNISQKGSDSEQLKEQDEEYNERNIMNIKELLQEKEFLEKKFHKYKEKYFKFKLKYQELKTSAKMFMKYHSKFILNDNNYTVRALNEKEKKKNVGILKEKKKKLLKKKRSRDIFKLVKSSSVDKKSLPDIFDNKLSEDDDIHEIDDLTIDLYTNNKYLTKDEGKTSKKEDNDKKVIKNNKKKKETQEEEENEFIENTIKIQLDEQIDYKDNESILSLKSNNVNVTNKKKPKQRGRKKNIDIKKKEKSDEDEKAKRLRNEIPSHINPLKREQEKQIDISIKGISQGIIDYIKSEEEIKESKINNLLDSLITLTDKITLLLETILSNISEFELSRIISLIHIFIKSQNQKVKSSTIISSNFLEFLNQNIVSLSKSRMKFKVTKNSSIYDSSILKQNSSALNIISFILNILYIETEDITPISSYIFNLIVLADLPFEKTKQVLKFINDTYSNENFHIGKIFLSPDDLNKYTSNENANLFYFITKFRSVIISENILNFIFKLFALSESDKAGIDLLLTNTFSDYLNKIPNEATFSINDKDTFSLNKDILYLEIYQLLIILLNIRSTEWISEHIFTNILWEIFSKAEINSKRRAYSIYYSSVLFEIALRKESTSFSNSIGKIFVWLCGIFNPQKNVQNAISFYDRICALSWVVDSAFIKKFANAMKMTKMAISDLIEKYSIELFPFDFINILKKNKFIE